MIELTPAPAPDEALTANAPPAAGDRDAERPRSPVDLTARLDGEAGRRRPPAEGGAWVRLREEASAEARAGTRPAGPLDGTIVAVKDLVAVAGLPLGAGSRARAGAPPEPADAGIVRVLRAAGAVVAGTVTLHELAFGVSGLNDEVGFPANPHDRARVPGGSSSGSAVAVADRTCDLAVGTDTGGSVRIPAALCGVVGFKPAGRYPLDGVLPLAPTLDQVGFLARSVADVARAHRVVTGAPGAGPRQPPDHAGGAAGERPVGPRRRGHEPAPDAAGDRVVAPDRAGEWPAGRVRIGVEAAGLANADGPVADAVEAALRALRDAGCELVDVGWPDRDEVLDVSTTIMFAEAAAAHRRLLESPAAGLLGAPVAARFRAGAAIPEADYRAARAAADRLAAAARQVLGTVDAVVGPTVPIVAPTIEDARRDEALPRRLVAETRLANLARLSALTIPIPALIPSSPTAGLPVGLQITGTSDTRTLAVGAAIASGPFSGH